MQIRIRKQGEHQAVLISFDTDSEKFDSNSERNKFFQDLHGRRQIIVKKSSRYVYEREGVLDTIPHLNVAQSVFIVMQENLRAMEEFFSRWEDKVQVKTFPVMITFDELETLKKLRRERENVQQE
ncbi:MAG TPA: hypothetical protein VJH90_00135 [archaeon]|nr:hypothetical protein [archaeon]